MNTHRTRRVKRVRLGAKQPELVRRGAILLEDALHTASLPEAERARLLIVRSFNVGVIRSSQSPAALALRIERQFRLMRGGAVYALDPSARFSEAVYFQNDTEPFVLLCVKLARGERVDEWFWPLAVPLLRNAVTKEDALRLLLFAASEQEQGAARTALLMGELFALGALDTLLATLRPEDGAMLLRSCGWNEAGRAPRRHASYAHAKGIAIPAQWQALVLNWVTRWGAYDARSVWLAAAALVALKPLRLADARLVRRAQELIQEVTAKSFEAQAHAEKASQAKSEDCDLLLEAENGSSVSVEDENLARIDASVAPTPSSESLDAGPQDKEEFASAQALMEDEEDARVDSPKLARDSLPTAYAGLYFLLPLIARLGMSELLGRHEHLIELDFPHRLLRHVAATLDVPEDDPIMRPLVVEREVEDELAARCEFVMHVSWREEFNPSRRLVMRRLVGQKGAHLLFDEAEQMALALWRGKASRAAEALMAGVSLKKGAALRVESEMNLLLDAWVVAMRRWLMRYAGIGLEEVVCRHGSIVATRTHLEIFFGLGQADISVRRAGLDLDPGWVEWLGRVVLFHYLDGELNG